MTDLKTISLLIGSLLLVSSCLYKNNKISLISLFLGSFLIACFFALLDPYLILWDEQFHALVAKHLADNPLKPLLYRDAVLPYDYRNWAGNYIWLHKQPLFLWQMALSIKLFGCNEFAVRLPSILMHALLTLLTFRIGTILFNRRIGILAAIFFSFAKYPLELVCGKYGTDHNDFAFMFYVTASLWALLEYKQTKNNKWIYLIGLFSGCAILVKWLVGLVVYLCWVISSFFTRDTESKKEIISILKSFCVTILVALPWQLYVLYQFPLESKYEFNYNSEHLFNAIEGHTGELLFYWRVLNRYYGEGDLVPYIILFTVVFGLYKINNKNLKVIAITFISSVYLFYTIAATKMTSFCIICAPFIFVCLACSLQYLFDFLCNRVKYLYLKQVLYFITISFISLLFLNYDGVILEHSVQKEHYGTAREIDMYARTIMDTASKKLGNNKYVVFNASITTCGEIPFMFYTNYIAYGFIPSMDNCKTAKSKGYRIAVLKNKPLPDYIEQDTSVAKINY